MYDWNENSSTKGEYIANKTHWIEFGDPAPICGGNQHITSYYSPYGSVWYTEKTGQVWFNQGRVSVPIQVNGPSYFEVVIEESLGGNPEAHYHITEVFENKQGWYWQNKNRSLLEVFAGDNMDDSGTNFGAYYYDYPYVHIKKTELFQNDNEFVDYCNTRLGEVDQTNGPTEAQRQIAKEILDEFAYKICGGWVYICKDTGNNGYMYINIINPSDAWKNYWGWSSQYGFKYSSNHYYWKRTSSSVYPPQNGFFMVPVWPEGTDEYSSLKAGTWGDMGETGLATYNPVTYHPLETHYLPPQIQQMMEDVSKYLQAIAPEPQMG